MSAETTRRLHWGCGGSAAPGWINSDRGEYPGVDLVCDIRDGLPLAGESVDYAVSIHALPEIPYGDLVPALQELRRVLKPGGVVGVTDGSSPLRFRYPTNPVLDAYDALRLRQRERDGRQAIALQLRALLRQAGFVRTEATGGMSTESGPPAGTPDETRRVAQTHVISLRGTLGEEALAEGWVSRQELEQMVDALTAWGDDPDAFYARPVFQAIAWS